MKMLVKIIIKRELHRIITSIISTLEEILDAWLMEQVLLWQQWTSLSCMEVTLQISLMLVEVQTMIRWSKLLSYSIMTPK
jgi:hypothetical protein